MLVSLHIQNVVLIKSLDLHFDDGLCALTGETGAGKSILLDALGLALGMRAEARLVRKGADQAKVSATFDISTDHPALEILEEADVTCEGGELILRRSLTADGRSKAHINDQPVSIGLLRQVGEALVEIHGQFETQGLLDPSSHRGLLDEYAAIGNECQSAWQTWQQAKAALQALRDQSNNAREEEEFLRTSLEDLDALAPKAGEEDEFAALRERLMHKEKVLEALSSAYQALDSEDDPVRTAWGLMERVADKMGEGGEPIIDALARASSEVQEALAQIQSLSADLQEGDHNLESIDNRLFALRAQARKHNCAVDDLPAKREELALRLNDIEHADEALAARQREESQAKDAYIKAAQAVRDKREAAAAKLDGLIARELPPLKLEKARFVTQLEALEEGEWSATGMDRVRFLVATNPGSDPGPLNKIASGGEMSRFMLALKVVMAETGSAQTLIFDEVDAGIGGATADAVGERLARLSRAGKQILVVTHAPQVAARAQHHYIVAKEGDKTVNTTVIPLQEVERRREEIARMLAGAEITNEARAAADKLLETGKAA